MTLRRIFLNENLFMGFAADFQLDRAGLFVELNIAVSG